ncbi:MarR family winged helix-turn-helix transcriptional regulator [Oleiharenicola sp. Vm1]|uniref:MarR family winged helix-turn-helix transcriptional regulator n=1 Tax=Oleiharenicola sp. Vm1 TaxID=3398393 RepID=UPI0039F51D0A
MPRVHAHEARRISLLLSDINRQVRSVFDRRVKHLGLTRAQWMFLFYLGREPGMTQSQLAELMQMEKISVSRQAERLESAGWIERRDDRADARAYRLYPTARAGRVVAKLNALADELRADYLEGLPAGRIAALTEDLGRIRANLVRLRGAEGSRNGASLS